MFITVNLLLTPRGAALVTGNRDEIPLPVQRANPDLCPLLSLSPTQLAAPHCTQIYQTLLSLAELQSCFTQVFPLSIRVGPIGKIDSQEGFEQRNYKVPNSYYLHEITALPCVTFALPAIAL